MHRFFKNKSLNAWLLPIAVGLVFTLVLAILHGGNDSSLLLMIFHAVAIAPPEIVFSILGLGVESNSGFTVSSSYPANPCYNTSGGCFKIMPEPMFYLLSFFYYAVFTKLLALMWNSKYRWGWLIGIIVLIALAGMFFFFAMASLFAG